VSRGRAAALLALVAAALLAYAAPRIRFSTDVADFLPDARGDEDALLSRLLRDTELSRTMILALGAPDEATAVAAGRELAQALRENEALAWLRSGPDPELPRRVYELYFPRRFLFLSDAPEAELPKRLSDAGLRDAARRLRRDLALPAGTLLEEVAPADPLGAFRGLLERLRGAPSGLRVQDDQFLAGDGRHAILFLATRASGFDTRVQAPLLADVAAAFARVNAAHGGSLSLESSGVNRYVVAGENRVRGDAAVIASLSFLGVGALFLLAFRRGGSLLLAMLPGVFGILAAASAGLLAFGDLDGITLAFGTTLLGLTIDYPIHLLNHWALSPAHESARAVARRIAPSLGLGAATTMASFAGLALTALPGFRQIAFFSVVGVGAALAVTLLAVPALLPDHGPLPDASRRAAAGLGRAVIRLEPHRRLLAGLALGITALAGWGVARLGWQDELAALSPPDPALFAEDQRVRARVSPVDSGRFVVSVAEGADAAVSRNDAVYEALHLAVERGQLEGLRSLHDFLWSAELQERNWSALTAEPDLADRVERAFAAEGFRPGAFAPFREALAAGPPPPLRLPELRSSELGALVGPLVLDLGGRTGVVTLLRGLRDPDAVAAALAGIPGVRLFDQQSFVTGLYREFRDATVRQILVGSALVFAVLWLRYRAARPACAAILPSLLAALAVLGALGAAGIHANLLHALALVLVMGQGVDYGIFVVDSSDRARDFGATMLSLVLSCATTLLAYGTLAISAEPALRSVGLTTGAGILLCLLLSPLSFLLLGRRPAEVLPA
jgi:predicted exporter